MLMDLELMRHGAFGKEAIEGLVNSWAGQDGSSFPRKMILDIARKKDSDDPMAISWSEKRIEAFYTQQLSPQDVVNFYLVALEKEGNAYGWYSLPCSWCVTASPSTRL